MSPLEERIRGAILANGPMPVSLYMLMCLHDPQHGYYATRPAFNRDFTTAPETSQIFGELLGAWTAHEWRQMGSPKRFHLVELGPGRGAMMDDMLRATASVDGFLDAARVTMVEASPLLRNEQARALKRWEPVFYDTLENVPEGPAIILGNEFLDCLPVRQFVREGDGWRERAVGIDRANSRLVFGHGLPADLPEAVEPIGDEVEAAAAIETIADALGQRFAKHKGRALFIDYGDASAAPGDTLRAYRDGKQVDPLSSPGACDLTTDVDFGRLKRLSEKAGLVVHGPVEQGYLLSRLGAKQRAETLAARNQDRADDILAGERKLTAPDAMGARFKAICLSAQGLPAPAGFETE